MIIDTTDPTEFGWRRAAIYTAIAFGIHMICWMITELVSATAAPWIDPGFPGLTFAAACGVAWEFCRRDRARREMHS